MNLGTPGQRMRASLAILSCLCLMHVFILVAQARRTFPNIDEGAHLLAGIEHRTYGTFDYYRVSPPLADTLAAMACTDPAELESYLSFPSEVGMRPEFLASFKALTQFRSGFYTVFIAPRFCLIFFSIFGLWVLVAWTGHYRQALLLAGLYLFDPGTIAFSPMIGPDSAATSVGVFACWLAYIYSQNDTRANACWAGVATGLALLTKLTWLTAILTVPITTIVSMALIRRSRSARSVLARLGDLACFWMMAVSVLNAGYQFEGLFNTLGELEFCSEMLGGEGCNARIHGNRFNDTWLACVPVPVPRNYLLGVDYLKCEVEEKKWSFLNGEWKQGSWAHYYVLTTLYKTPEPTLVGALIGLGVLLTGIRRRMVKPEVISMFLFLIIPPAVCFASVSLQGGFNHHHRYVLMIYPPMFALAAYIASPVGIRLLKFRLPLLGKRKRSVAIPLAITLAVLSAASSLRVHPFYTSYFNTLSGGPENGWRLLGFSNIDWGQDILEVDKWLKAHPERRPLVMDIDYFGMNGDLFDVPTTLPPQLPKGASIDEVRRSVTETQWWIISVKKLYNHPGHNGVEYLQQIAPVERIAYAYHVYRIDPLPKEE
jgi:hypothetical protein